MKLQSPDNGPQHGVAAAYYSGGPGPRYYLPVMECCCGWTSDRCEDWASAGTQLDQHLEFSFVDEKPAGQK